LYRNGALVTTTAGAVTTYTDTPVSPSFAYDYQVQARDAAGNVSGLSSLANVTTPADTTAPSVSLTAPGDGATVNANVILSADTIDNVGVDHVDFLVNGSVVGTADVEGGPYSFVWDSTTTSDGPVTITARAVDGSANATTSSVGVTVNNAGATRRRPGNFSAAARQQPVDLNWAPLSTSRHRLRHHHTCCC
jgi:chitodextrinase